MIYPSEQDLIYMSALLLVLFDEDSEKAQNWFDAVNPSLGDIRPVDLILIGKFDRLLKFVEDRYADFLQNKEIVFRTLH